MELKQYGRRDFTVRGVQVTADNLEAVATWCGGTVEEQSSKGRTEKYVKVNVHRPLNEKQTRAYVSDWVLESPTGFKVYTDRAFEKSFEERDGHRNVFEQAAEVQAIVDAANTKDEDPPQELRTVDVPAETTRDRLGFNQPKNLMEA